MGPGCIITFQHLVLTDGRELPQFLVGDGGGRERGSTQAVGVACLEWLMLRIVVGF